MMNNPEDDQIIKEQIVLRLDKLEQQVYGDNIENNFKIVNDQASELNNYIHTEIMKINERLGRLEKDIKKVGGSEINDNFDEIFERLDKFEQQVQGENIENNFKIVNDQASELNNYIHTEIMKINERLGRLEKDIKKVGGSEINDNFDEIFERLDKLENNDIIFIKSELKKLKESQAKNGENSTPTPIPNSIIEQLNDSQNKTQQINEKTESLKSENKKMKDDLNTIKIELKKLQKKSSSDELSKSKVESNLLDRLSSAENDSKEIKSQTQNLVQEFDKLKNNLKYLKNEIKKIKDQPKPIQFPENISERIEKAEKDAKNAKKQATFVQNSMNNINDIINLLQNQIDKLPNDLLKLIKCSSNQNSAFIIDINDYKVIREIKKGGFGVINLVRDKKNGREYASKTNFMQSSLQNKLDIFREVSILSQVHHPTIIQFRGYSHIDFDHKENTTILMDYMNNGSLADLISKENRGLRPPEYDDTKKQIILIGIARGMMILHKLNIIHRDLKPENILLDEDYNPHIADFGLSKFFNPDNSNSQSRENIGTLFYIAPEVIDGKKYNTKADVYAFGIIMYEVISGQRAFSKLLQGDKLNVFNFQKKILEGLRPKIEEGLIKKSFKDLIEKCWSKDPPKRPTFSEIYEILNLSNNNDDSDNKFCLDDAVYDDVLDYVSTISDEPKLKMDQESNKDEKETIISKIIKDNEQLKSDSEILKKENIQILIRLDKIENDLKTPK